MELFFSFAISQSGVRPNGSPFLFYRCFPRVSNTWKQENKKSYLFPTAEIQIYFVQHYELLCIHISPRSCLVQRTIQTHAFRTDVQVGVEGEVFSTFCSVLKIDTCEGQIFSCITTLSTGKFCPPKEDACPQDVLR